MGKTFILIIAFLFSFTLAASANQETLQEELLLAIESNDLTKVQSLVGAGQVDVNYSFYEGGMTPLARAAELCRVDVTKYLLQQGAQPKKTVKKRYRFVDKSGYIETVRPYTPIGLSAFHASDKVESCYQNLKQLVSTMTNLTKKQHLGLLKRTLLKVEGRVVSSVSKDRVNKKAFSWLLSLYPARTVEIINDEWGKSKKNIFTQVIDLGNENLIRSLLALGAEPQRGMNFLCKSPVANNLNLLKDMVKKYKFDINEFCPRGKKISVKHNLVAKAVDSEKEDLLKFLLNNGANYKKLYAIYKGSALHLAVSKENLSITNMILDFDSGLLNTKNGQGYTPLEEALLRAENLDIFEALLARTPMVKASQIYLLYEFRRTEDENKLKFQMLTQLIPKTGKGQNTAFNILPLVERILRTNNVSKSVGQWEAKSLALIIDNFKVDTARALYNMVSVPSKESSLPLHSIKVLVDSEQFSESDFIVSAYASAKSKSRWNDDYKTVASWLEAKGIDCFYKRINYCR